MEGYGADGGGGLGGTLGVVLKQWILNTGKKIKLRCLKAKGRHI